MTIDRRLLALSAWVFVSWPAGVVLAEDLPLPPVPPDMTTLRSSAPVPDANVQDPSANTIPAAKFTLRLYRNDAFNASYGFTPGSRYQSTEDKKAIQTPGFSVTVPIK